MGDSGREHLEEVVLQFELLVLYYVRYTPRHYHLVGAVLKQDLLLLECDNFLMKAVLFFCLLRKVSCINI